MILKNYYYYFQSALSPKLCDDILNYGKRHESEMAVTGDSELPNATDKNGKLKESTLKNIQKNLIGYIRLGNYIFFYVF